MARKLFVGSLPNGIPSEHLAAEFGKYGQVEDVFVKPGCEQGRQWGFVTMASPEGAQLAKDATDRVLMFPGCERPCDVKFAKNNDPLPGGQIVVSTGDSGLAQPKKIFVGSLPNTITDADLRTEFSKYGTIVDIHINHKSVEHNRQWCFITYTSSEMAQIAKMSADRQTMFPGCDRAVEVALARHQGMYGQDSLATDVHGMPVVAPPTTVTGQGAVKIFVGSLPPGVSIEQVTAEFSKYGQVTNVHINEKPCEPGRNWAFVTFATPEQANYAREATNKVTIFPGAERPCEVMLAKNQGKNGQDPLSCTVTPARTAEPAVQGYAQVIQPQLMHQVAVAAAPSVAAQIPMGSGPAPPPPAVPPPPSITPWRMYKTSTGLPYYHNHSTGQTQWEAPSDLMAPGHVAPAATVAYGAAHVAAIPQAVHYAPY